VKLNLGCGEYRQEGWTNVDSYPGVNPDVVADLASLPFDDAVADAVYVGHCLEHNEPGEIPAILAEIRRVLKPGGGLCVVAPDLDRIDPVQQAVLYRMADVGGDDTANPRGSHRWGCTETVLLGHVRDVFPDAHALPVADLEGQPWPVVSYVGWQCAILATRPAGPKPVTAKVVTAEAKPKPRTSRTATTKATKATAARKPR